MQITKLKQTILGFGLPKFFSVVFTIIVFIFIVYAYSVIRSNIQSLNYVLSPPELPNYQPPQNRKVLPQNWSNEDSEWFHYVSQGTATIPIPYDWLLALERPERTPWLIYFGDEGRFVDNEYILRLGFIKGEISKVNPDGLPYGFAKTESQNLAGLENKVSAVGFTCAACHTGHVIYEDTEYIIEGGPAVFDSGLFTKTLGAALGQTALSSKLPILNGRFERFAKNVLGKSFNLQTEKGLKKQLLAVVSMLSETSDTIHVTEGFSRLDALNRIGNQVFSQNLNRESNYSAINAPVNFPHIWTSSWFDWVQYDASIMQPLVRNTGEALGVKAYVDTTAPLNDQRFSSAVPINNLVEIENLLAGAHPNKYEGFGGLSSPSWPESFPAIDEAKRELGKYLYNDNCKGCHLPVLTSDEIWESTYFSAIEYSNGSDRKTTPGKYLRLNVIPLAEIGTDPNQSNVLATRTVDTIGLGLDTDICSNAPKNRSVYESETGLISASFKDSSVASFAFALGAFVQMTNDQWMVQNFIPAASRPHYNGGRPNCLRSGLGYKARPLNGIWATAPFLHNGSIASLYQLLSPLEDRETFVQLGSQVFDAEKVGVFQDASISIMDDLEVSEKYIDGRFIVDTRVKGNWNIGHQFEKGYVKNGDNPSGIIGRLFSEKERYQLIEYLKTL